MTHAQYGRLTLGLIAAWFAFSFIASTQHLYVTQPPNPPLPILLAVLVPIADLLRLARRLAGISPFCLFTGSTSFDPAARLEAGRLHLPDAVCLRHPSGFVRPAGWFGRYGDWGHRALHRSPVDGSEPPQGFPSLAGARNPRPGHRRLNGRTDVVPRANRHPAISHVGFATEPHPHLRSAAAVDSSHHLHRASPRLERIVLFTGSAVAISCSLKLISRALPTPVRCSCGQVSSFRLRGGTRTHTGSELRVCGFSASFLRTKRRNRCFRLLFISIQSFATEIRRM